MKHNLHALIAATSLAALLAGVGATAAATLDAQGTPQTQPPQQQQQPPSAGDKNDKSKQPAPISMDQPAAASAEEEGAFKAFQSAPQTDPAAKNKLGEDFVEKYPQSRYRAAVYQGLVSGYFATNQVPKLLDAGDK